MDYLPGLGDIIEFTLNLRIPAKLKGCMVQEVPLSDKVVLYWWSR